MWQRGRERKREKEKGEGEGEAEGEMKAGGQGTERAREREREREREKSHGAFNYFRSCWSCSLQLLQYQEFVFVQNLIRPTCQCQRLLEIKGGRKEGKRILR